MNYYTMGLYLTVNWHDGGVYCSIVLCSLSKINYLNKLYIGVLYLYNVLTVVPFIIFDHIRKRINLTVINSLLGNCNTFGYSISETRVKPFPTPNKRSAGQMCSWTQMSFTVDRTKCS